MEALEHINELLEEARKYNERRLIVLSGEREKSYEILRMFLNEYEGKVVYLAYMQENMAGVESYHIKDCDKLLGTTYDCLILDIYHSFQPADLGKLYGIVRGGGIIFLITPPIEKWKDMLNRYHYHILTPPYKEHDIRRNFIKWFVTKLWQHNGIAIIENGNVLKKGNFKSKLMERKKIKVPEETKFNKIVYEIALTQEQIEFLKIAENFLEKDFALVLKANRGRGKSSIIGIALAAIIEKVDKKMKILIIAPDRKNTGEIFKFLLQTFQKLEIEYENKGSIIFTRNAIIKYMEPFDAYNEKADFIVVDEAASIAPHILLKYMENSGKLIYSSTIHGYEGAGRSFSIRFLNRLKEMKANHIEFEMEEPIRYSTYDPIERWVFDALLLDAEPATLERIEIEKLEYEKIDVSRVIEEEDKIRQFFGILIMAHYKNNPNDFAILCDAPNQIARALSYNGRIVCSMQIAMEGKLGKNDCDETYFKSVMIPGNIIPQVLIRHYRKKRYGKYRGMRIVRIATHPDFFRHGIGSHAIKMVEMEAIKSGMDYIGVSFGATIPLLKFWMKNGFVPVHITPTVNRVSGENSLIMIKPLSKKFEKELEKVRKQFTKRFMMWLIEPLRDFNSNLSLMIIDSYEGSDKFKMDEQDIKRLFAYIWDGLTYKTVKDCLFKLTYNFFLAGKKNILNRKEKLLLLTKNLQCKSWERVASITKCNECEKELKEAVKKIIMHYYGDRDEVAKFQKEIQGND